MSVPDSSAPGNGAPKPQGKVSKGVNIGIDVGYAIVWAFVTLIGVAGLFNPAARWPSLAVIAFGGYFAYRNISNIIVHPGGRLMRRAITLAGAGAAAIVALAACGGQAAGGSQPSEQPAPAVASWQLGGAYTGPVPPVTGLPSPAGGLRFAPVTDGQGYTEQLTVRVGAPLHFNVPQVLQDCYTAYPDQRGDLAPACT